MRSSRPLFRNAGLEVLELDPHRAVDHFRFQRVEVARAGALRITCAVFGERAAMARAVVTLLLGAIIDRAAQVRTRRVEGPNLSLSDALQEYRADRVLRIRVPGVLAVG